MGIGQPALQLVFNIVMITGVASLARICCLLKRDNQRLAAELKLPELRDRAPSEIMPAKAEPPASATEESTTQDIRQWAAERLRRRPLEFMA